MNVDERFHFRVGTLECLAIKDGTELHPISELAIDVPQEKLAQALDEYGVSSAEMDVDFNCLLVDTGKHRVLVDVGWGQSTRRRDGRLVQYLREEGITPQEIEYIVVTHGDADHIGGIVNTEGQPVFPNACYIMWREGWNFWLTHGKGEKVEGDYTPPACKYTLQVLQERIKVVDAETEFLPGFWIIPTIGHRPDHIALAVSSAGERLLHVGDAIGHPILMAYPGWCWSHHSSPDQALRDKQMLLERAEAGNALVFGSHLPFPGVGRVIRRGEGWRWQPITAQDSSSIKVRSKPQRREQRHRRKERS